MLSLYVPMHAADVPWRHVHVRRSLNTLTFSLMSPEVAGVFARVILSHEVRPSCTGSNLRVLLLPHERHEHKTEAVQ